MKEQNTKSQKTTIIVLACILAVAVTALVLILTLKPKNEEADQPEKSQDTVTAEIGDTGSASSDTNDESTNQPEEPQDTAVTEGEETSFVPGENDKIIEAVDDLEYCVLTMRYYFNAEGSLYRVEHTAEYSDAEQAKLDYAVIESMGEFSDYSLTDKVIYSVLTPDGINRNYPDATVDSIIEYVKSKNMTYEVIQ